MSIGFPLTQPVFFHGTSLGLYEKILQQKYLSKPVYVTTSESLAKKFSLQRIRFHPDKEQRKHWLVLTLDLSNIPLEPDPDPEAQEPPYKGKLFRTTQNVPINRIIKVNQK
jgi:hypothetical protein